MVLFAKDRIILLELDSNARQSNIQIARKAGLSKQVVNYRINKLVKDGTIKGFRTIVNAGLLGYQYDDILIKCRTFRKEREEEFIKYVMDAGHISWFVECSGQYDYMLAMLSRNRTELEQQISELTSRFADYIAEYEILSIVGARKLEYKYLSDGPMPSAFTGTIQEEGTPVQIDDTDLKILERLDQDARTPIADLAAHADTTPNIVAHRIRRLKEKGIIQGFRTIIDTDKTGKEWHIILFKLTPSEKEVRKLTSFLREHPNCTHLVTGFGSWQLMADFHVNNTKELDGIIEQIRAHYSDIIKTHTTLRIPKVHKTVFFPRKDN